MDDDITEHERIALDIVNGNLTDAREALKGASPALVLDVVFMVALHDDIAPNLICANHNALGRVRTLVSTLHR